MSFSTGGIKSWVLLTLGPQDKVSNPPKTWAITSKNEGKRGCPWYIYTQNRVHIILFPFKLTPDNCLWVEWNLAISRHCQTKLRFTLTVYEAGCNWNQQNQTEVKAQCSKKILDKSQVQCVFVGRFLSKFTTTWNSKANRVFMVVSISWFKIVTWEMVV